MKDVKEKNDTKLDGNTMLELSEEEMNIVGGGAYAPGAALAEKRRDESNDMFNVVTGVLGLVSSMLRRG